MCIRVIEEHLKIDDVFGVQDHGMVYRIDWEDEDTIEEIERLERLGELPENAHEDDILTYLGY